MTTDDLWFGTSGPHDAQVVIVGEAWGEQEAAQQKPFVGTSGTELSRILAEAGINRDACLMTNVLAERPPQNQMWRYFNEVTATPVRGLYPSVRIRDGLRRLANQLSASPRQLVIGCGNYPLWALTNCSGHSTSAESEGVRVPSGIMNWRGSMWYTETLEKKIPFLPIIHPAAILRQWDLRAVTLHDLKARVPMALRGDWRPNPAPVFWAPPTFEQAKLKLQHWISRAETGERFRLVCDVETARALLTCVGLTDSEHFGMSIPFVRPRRELGIVHFDSYWPMEQEVELVNLIRRVLSHPNILVEGQNFLYDIQYLDAYLAIRSKLDFDTMLAHHLLWPGTPKGLDYLSSLYCTYHWFWKEDSKEWDTKGSIEQLLGYNCIDLVRQFECGTALRELIPRMGMEKQWTETLARNDLALRMMLRGVKIDRARRARYKIELTEVLSVLYHELGSIIPQWMLPVPKKGAKPTPWYRSPKQQQFVFGEILGMRLPKHRKTGRTTLGGDTLVDLGRKYPEFKGIFRRLDDARSVAVYQSHFVEAPLDPDDRMRCQYGPAGTETFRFNSSANAFRRGTNLQNLPVGDED